ncbi:hypothetical protein F4818DRAFT_437133 [Hypoxylon cercidicola]|nr:hypothetical protein F4818DRAFT_437133 [Hypoxylon cercidicola]
MGDQPVPPIYRLPMDIIYSWSVTLYRDDPATLVQLANATPELFFTKDFNLGRLDARSQGIEGNPLLGTQALFTLAIHMEESFIHVIRYYLDELDKVDANAINGILPSGRKVEPPLHSAVRAGREDVVQLLLGRYGNLQLGTVYCNIRVFGGCQWATRAHLGQCSAPPGQVLWKKCTLPTASATDWYLREQRARIRVGIENATLPLILRGQHPVPATNPAYIVSIFSTAFRIGMETFAEAVVRATLNLPPGDPARGYLVTGGGLSALFRAALEHSYSTDLLEYFIEEANKCGTSLFSGVANFLTLAFHQGTRPPFGPNHMPNALLTLRRLMYEATLSPQGLQMLFKQLLQSLNTNLAAAEDAVHEYFLLELEACDQLIANQAVLSPGARQDARSSIDRLADLAFWCPAGLNNAKYLIHHRGYNTRPWLVAAIEFKNGPVMDEILTYWSNDIEPLRQNVDFSDYRHTTPLIRCIQLRFLSGIIKLLDAGIPASDVSYEEWEGLAYILRKQLDEYAKGARSLDQIVDDYYFGQYYKDLFTKKFKDNTPQGLGVVDGHIRREFEYVIRVADGQKN